MAARSDDMAWKSLIPSQIPLLSAGGPTERLLDPYAAWACLTEFRGFVLRGGGLQVPLEQRRVDVIAELENPGQPIQPPIGDVAPVYAGTIGGQHARHITMTLAVDQLAALWRHPAFRRWELGTALKPGLSFKLAQQPAGLALFAAASAVAPVLPPSVLGVIDHGCAFVHRQLRVDGRSRVVHLWDQGSDATGPWSVPPAMGYGRELGQVAINRILKGYLDDPGDEALVYTTIGYLILNDRPAGEPYLGTHGTHVSDLLAGSTHRLLEKDDAASAAPLAFVHLPIATVLDSTGGSLAPKVLDGLRYLLAHTQQDEGLVVNISYGTQAGPHDGSSLIEAAMDELLTLRPRDFAIVVGAGNSQDKKAHARYELFGGDTLELVVRLPDDDVNDSFVEVWYATPADPLDVPLIAAAAPGKESGTLLRPNQHAEYREADGSIVAALQHYAAVPNGTGSMALLALAGSRKGDGAPSAPAGDWRIRMSLPDAAPMLVVHAWVERDDLPRDGVGRPIAFTRNSPIETEGTLANLATGTRTIVVGAARLSDGKPTPYTSLGATRDGRPQPAVLGPAEENTALAGLRAAGVRSGFTFRMGGTSVAAPVVARELYKELERERAAGRHIERDGWEAALDRIIASEDGDRLKIRRPG